jgi:hypothetical protein
MSREDRDVLWQAFWQDRSTVNRNALLVKYAHLASIVGLNRALARGQVGHVVDEDDRAQDLVLVLVELINAYDPLLCGGQGSFEQYAVPRLAKRVVSCEREYDPFSRTTRAEAREGQRELPSILSIDAPAKLGDDDVPGLAYSISIGAERLAAWDQVRQDKVFRKWLMRHLHRRARLFALLRWWRGWSVPKISRRLNRHESWGSLEQAAIRDRILDVLGRPELKGTRCVRQLPTMRVGYQPAERRAA